MKRWIVAASLLIVLVSLAVACASPAPTPRATPAPTSAPAPSLVLPEDRLIVRTGNVSLLVDDAVQAMDMIAGLASDHGGYVLSTSVEASDGGKRARISFRVPPEEFDSIIVELRRLAIRVVSETTDSQDVTEEYVDLQARLRNLEASEQQLQSFMQRAQTITDVLSVQRELTSVRGDIEQTKGRLQYLERVSATSLFNVTLLPATSPEAVVRRGWDGMEILKSAARALVIFGQVLGTIGIWLGVFSPVWAPIVGIALWRRRRARRRG